METWYWGNVKNNILVERKEFVDFVRGRYSIRERDHKLIWEQSSLSDGHYLYDSVETSDFLGFYFLSFGLSPASIIHYYLRFV